MSKNAQKHVRELFEALWADRGITVTEPLVKLWLDGFSDCTLEEVDAAVRRFSRDCSEFPSVARVRGYLPGTKGLNDQQRSKVAWGVLRKAIREHGAYNGIEFDDPIIHAAVRSMGGWALLCSTDVDQMQWRQKDFEAAYVACARTGIGDGRALPGLPGTETKVHVRTGLCEHASVKRLDMSEPSAVAGHIAEMKGVD